MASGKQVASHIEGPGLAGCARRPSGFMASGQRHPLAQGIEDGGGGALVGGEQARGRCWCRARLRRNLGRNAGKYQPDFMEVLVASGTFLPVPALLIYQDDGGQQAEALDREGDVREVGDGTMAVLEIECIEELFGALGADFGQRFAHGERRTGVLGHGVGQYLGVGSVDGIIHRSDCGRRRDEGSGEKIRWTCTSARDQNTSSRRLGCEVRRLSLCTPGCNELGVAGNAGVQVENIAKSPAIAIRTLGHDPALE